MITKLIYFLHQLAAINVYNQDWKLHVDYSQSHMYHHACMQEAKQPKQSSNYLTHEHHVTLSLYHFVCARSTHIFCATININNHFNLILMSFLSPSPTANTPLEINWFSYLSFSLPYIKCSAQNKLSWRQQNGSSGSRTIRLSNSLI